MLRFTRAVLLLLPASLAAQAPAAINVVLRPVVPVAGTSLRWSPKGATVPLTLAGRTLTGTSNPGPAGSPPIAVRLAKGPGEVHFNILWVDVNRDGKLSENEKLTVVPKDTRGKWWSSFDTIISVPVPAEGGHAATMRPYPLALWYVEDPQEPTAPPTLRWSRRGWHMGTTEIAGKPAWVLITEMEMDGVFDQRDSWAISRDSVALLKAMSRDLDRHNWLDGLAYRPVSIDPNGRSLSFVQIQPATTEAEEKANDDPYLHDRDVARAEKPLPFGNDLAAALAAAKRDGKRVLVDFEAVWCGPCHTMDQLVFTAQSVVTAAAGVIAVKVDGDDHHDLKVKYKVDGYPTLILFDSNGNELRRGVGYQSIVDMMAMLKP